MRKFTFSSLGIIFLFSLSTASYAAELYGKFSPEKSDILKDAKIIVKCGDWKQSVTIGRDGKYSVRGIPGNRGCFFTIQASPYTESAEVRFNTNRSVVTFNADLKLKSNRILVLRR